MSARHRLLSSLPIAIVATISGCLTVTNSLAADGVPGQIYLRNGTILRGESSATSSGSDYELQTDTGVDVTLPASQHQAYVTPVEDLQTYRTAVESIEDTPEGHRQVVDWASRKLLPDLVQAHYQRIVELSPDDVTAWSALQYQQTSLGYVPRDRYWRAKGMVRQGVRWRIPQDLAIAERMENRRKEEYTIASTLSTIEREFGTAGQRGSAARQKLAGLTQPAAIGPLAKLMGETKNENLRREILATLLRNQSQPGVAGALAGLIVIEANASWRNEMIAALERLPNEVAVQRLQSRLTNNNPGKDDAAVINRAAEALALIGDFRSIPRLIDVLQTEHIVDKSSAATNAAFRGDGGISFSPSGGSKKVKYRNDNDMVRYALERITGENFGYEVADWRAWYARFMTGSNLPLRRDP